ncbi:uncharacterized protein VTP21DRAFT_3919 [Calcarisporiella thermophila]|uniref:uncharacterized protein n=1 Tax=Calcarisporiella thermophila TaxID=911321 RepID=UPI0037446FE7
MMRQGPSLLTLSLNSSLPAPKTKSLRPAKIGVRDPPVPRPKQYSQHPSERKHKDSATLSPKQQQQHHGQHQKQRQQPRTMPTKKLQGDHPRRSEALKPNHRNTRGKLRRQRRRELRSLEDEAEALGDPEQQHRDMMFGAGSPPKRPVLEQVPPQPEKDVKTPLRVNNERKHHTMSSHQRMVATTLTYSPPLVNAKAKNTSRKMRETVNRSNPSVDPFSHSPTSRTTSPPLATNKAQHYAGPNFHNSPSPSTLPVPEFGGRTPPLSYASPLRTVSQPDEEGVFRMESEDEESDHKMLDENLRAKSRQLLGLLVAARKETAMTPTTPSMVHPQVPEYMATSSPRTHFSEINHMLKTILKIEN